MKFLIRLLILVEPPLIDPRHFLKISIQNTKNNNIKSHMKQNRVKDSTHYKNKVTKEEDGVGKAY